MTAIGAAARVATLLAALRPRRRAALLSYWSTGSPTSPRTELSSPFSVRGEPVPFLTSMSSERPEDAGDPAPLSHELAEAFRERHARAPDGVSTAPDDPTRGA